MVIGRGLEVGDLAAPGPFVEAERACVRALRLARATSDFAQLATLAGQLADIRRRKLDAALIAGPRAVVGRMADMPRPLAPGLYLIQPPMIGADARTLQETADRRGVPALVLAREPLTRAGKWPVVGVGPQVVRALVDPPIPLERVDAAPTRDRGDVLPEASWFLAASAALGAAALRSMEPDDPPQHRVDDLLDFLEAHPMDQSLLVALRAACEEAVGAPPPAFLRRRGGLDNPFSF